jgi:hypothetical protein
MRSSLLALLCLVSLGSAIGLDPTDFSLTGPAGFTPDFSSYASFSYSSGGGRSWGTGTYVGAMSFLLHPDLTAEVDLGYSRLFLPGSSDQGRYLGGIGLDWRATDNFTLQLRVDGAVTGEALRGY